MIRGIFLAFTYGLLVNLRGKKRLQNRYVVTTDEPHLLHRPGLLIGVTHRRHR